VEFASRSTRRYNYHGCGRVLWGQKRQRVAAFCGQSDGVVAAFCKIYDNPTLTVVIVLNNKRQTQNRT